MLELKAQLAFVEALFINFRLYMKEHMDNEKANQGKPSYLNKNYQNKNCGKYALKRKITMIRQELLNLEKLIDKEVI